MRKLLTPLLLVGAALISYSCSDDFLDRQPLDQIGSDAVWSDPNLADAYVSSIYGRVSDGYNRGWAWLAAGTDDAENSYPWPSMHRFNTSEIDPSSNPIDNWNGSYASIRRCNDFFDNIDRIETEPDRVARLTAEVRFLRAFFYFELNRNYGGVPLITMAQGLDGDDLGVARNSYSEVASFIISECDAAAAVLPTSTSGINVGRATRGAALALKARTQLYMEDWSGAAASAKTVIDSDDYSLFPDFAGIWAVANENNEEVIFDVQFQEPDRGHWANLFNTPIGTPGGGWGGTGPTQDLVDEFELTDGKLYTESDVYDETMPYANRDERFYASILHDGAPWAGITIGTRIGGINGIGTNGDATKTGYYVRKMIDEVHVAAQLQNPLSGSQNWIHFRLAEMYLIYAEGQNEASGPDQSVYDAVNAVRARVSMPDLPAGLSQDGMRQAIRHERRVELAFEEHRFWDARRWGIAAEAFNHPITGFRIGPNGELSGADPDGVVYGRFEVENRTYLPRTVIMPLPQGEIDKNPNLQQNPGY